LSSIWPGYNSDVHRGESWWYDRGPYISTLRTALAPIGSGVIELHKVLWSAYRNESQRGPHNRWFEL
jgi:hypothetical protein